MIGAIAGDIIGSVYEFDPIKTTEFPLFQKNSRFTDDTVMAIAVAYSILKGVDYGTSMKQFGRRYPSLSYGARFYGWIFENKVRPYNSWGNGSAMRVCPVGFAFDTADEALAEAKRTAEISHDHPEGIKGAQATALAILMARQSERKEKIRSEISSRFGYDLNRTVDQIRPEYRFDESCQRTVPEAIISFLDADDFEGTVRNAVSLGGDSDTLACIAGGIAQAFYKGVPEDIVSQTRSRLTPDLLDVVHEFDAKFNL